MRASLRRLRRLSLRGRLALGAGAGALVLVIVTIALGGPSPATLSHPGSTPAAKAFSLPALAGSGSRRSVSLSQYAGRPVIVNFFASWCEPCQKETPLLARFYHAHHGQVIIIGVDVNDGGTAALRFVHRSGAGYPVGTDQSAATAIRYGVAGLPQTFFLNARHLVVKRVFGAVTTAELDAGLARMR